MFKIDEKQKKELYRILNNFTKCEISAKIGILGNNNPVYDKQNNAAGVLAVHVYGSITHNIPKRDPLYEVFIREQQRIMDYLFNILKKNLQNIATINIQQIIKKSFNELAFFILNDLIKPEILTNGRGKWKSLSPITIKKKMGSKQMLIDTGLLFKSLAFNVS
jgi:hypothetical protein